MGNNIQTFSVQELFDKSGDYLIPIYQRNYAWGEAEITQLIQDIIDYTPQVGETGQNYYLGTLVVYERKNNGVRVFETIDGQQRLTTLSILVSVIKNDYGDKFTRFEKLNLAFSNRPNSTLTLDTAYKEGKFSHEIDYNDGIKAGYQLVKKNLKLKLEENAVSIDRFCEYLFGKVKLLRVPVPEDTELNHYFEIMNNRGEQLEKHEVLKSHMLEVLNQLNEKERLLASECFHLVWEACSNMEKYVQYGFSPEQRNSLFGHEWNNFEIKSFEDLYRILPSDQKNNQEENIQIPLSQIIRRDVVINREEKEGDSPDRFNSIINFPNFLLQVLRIQTEEDIPLDDKRLIKTFSKRLEKGSSPIEFVKTFGFNLLKAKFLFDKYIIKREFLAGEDRWSLKRLKQYEKSKTSYVNSFGDENREDDYTSENRRVLMLLSMFHVSSPTQVYKHWLNAALDFVFKDDLLTASAYIDYLESLAKAFVFNRFLAKEPLDYYELIYTNRGHLQKRDVDLGKLSFGRIENNLVFNYLDYLLWNQKRNESKIQKFEFTFRSSVEHYYPQRPKDGHRILDDLYLNSFGNLCLISHSKNSTLNNYMPSAKKDHYKVGKMDSVKQYLMMNDYNPSDWGEKSIVNHYEKIENILMHEFNKKGGSGETKAFKWFKAGQDLNKKLLARALMCFGDITSEVGVTGKGPRFNIFDWDRILKSEAYSRFEKYINEKNPRNLNEIIKAFIKSPELKTDPWRYSVVRWPAILDYCEAGNFCKPDSTDSIILMQGNRIDKSNWVGLYTFLWNEIIHENYSIDSWRRNDLVSFWLSEKLGVIGLEGDCLVEVKLKTINKNVEIIINRCDVGVHGEFLKRIRHFGYENIGEGDYRNNVNPYLITLTDNFHKNLSNFQQMLLELISSFQD